MTKAPNIKAYMTSALSSCASFYPVSTAYLLPRDLLHVPNACTELAQLALIIYRCYTIYIDIPCTAKVMQFTAWYAAFWSI